MSNRENNALDTSPRNIPKHCSKPSHPYLSSVNLEEGNKNLFGLLPPELAEEEADERSTLARVWKASWPMQTAVLR